MDICQGVSVAFQNTDAMLGATAGYGWGCSSIALVGRVGGGISTRATAVGAAPSVLNEYCSEEDDKLIPACIADIVGDTVGDLAGMGAVLLGSFAETACAPLLPIDGEF